PRERVLPATACALPGRCRIAHAHELRARPGARGQSFSAHDSPPRGRPPRRAVIPTVTDTHQPDQSTPPAVFQTVTVATEHAGKRLDRFLVDVVPELSRARVKTMLDAGQVRVN